MVVKKEKGTGSEGRKEGRKEGDRMKSFCRLLQLLLCCNAIGYKETRRYVCARCPPLCVYERQKPTWIYVSERFASLYRWQQPAAAADTLRGTKGLQSCVTGLDSCLKTSTIQSLGFWYTLTKSQLFLPYPWKSEEARNILRSRAIYIHVVMSSRLVKTEKMSDPFRERNLKMIECSSAS